MEIVIHIKVNWLPHLHYYYLHYHFVVGVSSEGEKAGGSRVNPDEEEGREAEASPARRGAGSRRSPRSTRARTRVTPIVWEPSVSMMPMRGKYYINSILSLPK